MVKATSRARDTYHVGNLAPLLLSAAREMLEEVGPTKLSMRAVSDRVGVSCTAAYHHYTNRADLLGHLAAQGFRELGKALTKRDSASSNEQELREASLAYLTFARRNPALYQLMFGPEITSAEMIPEFQAARTQAFGEVKKTIAEAFGLDVETSEVRSASLASLSHIHGLASLVIHGVLQLPPGASDEWLVDRALQGFENLFKVWHAEKGAGLQGLPLSPH